MKETCDLDDVVLDDPEKEEVPCAASRPPEMKCSRALVKLRSRPRGLWVSRDFSKSFNDQEPVLLALAFAEILDGPRQGGIYVAPCKIG